MFKINLKLINFNAKHYSSKDELIKQKYRLSLFWLPHSMLKQKDDGGKNVCRQVAV